MIQRSIVPEDSVEAELAYLYEKISLLDQLIRQLERFARLTGQLSSVSRRRRARKAQNASAGA
jgi:hypothetical protein